MRFTALVVLLVVAHGAKAETLVIHGATMGTAYHIKLVAELTPTDVQRLQADVDAVLADIDRQMSTYRPDSELSRFNCAPAGDWFAVSEATAEVAAAAQTISEQTDGALDVTVGPLVRLWHFGAKPELVNVDRAKPQAFAPPRDEEIAAARKLVGFNKLQVRMSPPALRKEFDGLEVDLSSIASGFAIDQLAELLAKRGVDNFMVEIGGEVRVAGKREDGRPWRVAIERPLAQERRMQTAVPLVDASIATAGDYRKFFEHGGKRYSHVIDPTTGRPIENTLGSVTVVADSCILADGWDTPLLVLGAKRGCECAERHGIAALFILHEEAGGKVSATSAWETRFGTREQN